MSPVDGEVPHRHHYPQNLTGLREFVLDSADFWRRVADVADVAVDDHRRSLAVARLHTHTNVADFLAQIPDAQPVERLTADELLTCRTAATAAAWETTALLEIIRRLTGAEIVPMDKSEDTTDED